MIEKFKTSLFGYSKREVCEYISKASDELTSKHNSQKKELEDKIQSLQEEIAKLTQDKGEAEKKIEALELKLKQATDDNSKVSEIIMDARRFADELKNKATEQNKIEMEENSKRNAAVESSIKKCKDEVDSIRAFIRKILRDTDTELEQIEQKLESKDDENEQ